MGIHWFILVTLVVVFIQGTIYKRIGLSRLTYSRYFSTRAVYEGEEVEMVERIANFKLLPLPWVRLESSIHAHLHFRHQANLDISSGQIYQNHKSLFSLMSYTQITRRHTIRCRKRGWYFLNSAAITYGDLLGMQSKTTDIKLSAELLVYPQPYPIENIPLPSHSWQGDITVKRWIVEDPFMISGIRDYRSGDPLHHINWKATARSGHLQVHKREYTADHRLLLLLNFEVTEKMWDAVTEPELIEKGISYAASISQYAISHGVETGFGCNGYTIDKPREPVKVSAMNGTDHLTAIFETMAKLVIARSIPFDTFLEQEVEAGTSNADILLITPFVSDKMQQQIKRLKERGNAVEILPLREDDNLPEGESPDDLSYAYPS